MFFKIGVLKNFTHVFQWILQIFKNSAFIENLQWLLFSVWQSNCSALGIYRPSFLNQKHNVQWFLLKRSVDLFRVHYIISRNHPNTFLLINLQKKDLSKVKYCSKGYLFWYQTFDSLDILISDEVSLISRKFKIHQENWQGRRSCFNEPVIERT